MQLRTGCTVRTLSQSRSGYAVQFETAEGSAETLRADAVICAMGGEAGPQFGTDGFGTRFAAQCGGRVEPLYPCLTALQCAKPRKALAGIRAKAAASLLDGARVLACENGEVQFTDYGLSGICIMQLSGLLAPGRGPKAPAVELDLFPAVDETALASLFAAHAAQTAGGSAADFWLGLLNQKLGRTVWSAAGLQDSDAPAVLTAAQWQKLAHTAKHWRFEGLAPVAGSRPRPPAAGWPCGRWISTSSSRAVRAFTLWAKRWTAQAAAAVLTCTGRSAPALWPGAALQAMLQQAVLCQNLRARKTGKSRTGKMSFKFSTNA